MRVRFFPDGADVVARGERVLWQGRPLATGLVRRLFPVRFLCVYFAALSAWAIVDGLSAGRGGAAIGTALLWTAAGATVVALSILAAALLFSRLTSYMVTDRRVVLQIGVALPIALTLPLRKVVSADLRLYPDGSGDIPLRLGDEKLAYLLLWPHVRPWHFRLPQPMLRAVPRATEVAATLSRALEAADAGTADVAIRIIAEPRQKQPQDELFCPT